jgi:trehalose/maltose hydrolase-like predicted phosphorylase
MPSAWKRCAGLRVSLTMQRPLSPPAVRGNGRRELPAYLSNGLMGLRVRDNPLAAGMTLLNGHSGLHPERKIEAAAIAPYPLAANIALNGVWLSDNPSQVTVGEQSYDFAHGELTSRLSFTAAGVRCDLEVLTFCCRHQPTLVVQQISARVDQACDLKLQAVINTHEIPGRLLARTDRTPGSEARDFDGSMLWESYGGLARCGLALVTNLEGTPQGERQIPGGGDRNPLTIQYGLRARAGKTYRLQQIVSLVPSVIHAEPDRHAERLVALARHYGFTQLRKANAAEWDTLWKGRIVLHGAGRRWQSLADAAFYYMNASVHVASPASTSMFGLATWHDYHYYYGHVMWDIESFSVPPLTFTQPDAARSLLEYRFANLNGARRNAQSFGRAGLQFPWESAPTTGQEAAPSPGTAAWHEDHISLDVALAFLRFGYATGDSNFLRDKAWPVVAGVCDWLVSRAHRSRAGYDIRRSMGIAERKTETDNDAFTALSGRQLLRHAIALARDLGREPGTDWQKLADRLVLPLRDGMLLPHEGFRANEEKAATPSPLMGIFPLEERLDPEVESATLRYYLKRADEYLGSPMLSAFYGVWAARTGNRRLSLKLLDEGYGHFIADRFLQTLEYRPDRFPEQPMAGPFFANMGGFLMSLLLGFPNLAVGPEPAPRWGRGPAVLPEGWRAIEVERLWIKGRSARLVARHGKASEIIFHD